VRSLIIKVIVTIILLTFFGAFLFGAVYTYLNLDLPKIEKLQDYKPKMASRIYSKDGILLAEIGAEKREVVAIKDIPKRVVDAFLSAEDDKFFEHKGVDYFGLARAMLANFKAGRVVQGGSTITQQVAKSLLLTSERSITRKVKDFILAQRIEEKLNKEEILHLYLNQVYLGNGYYGVKAAARGYFNKELKSMTVAESAMLAGLLVAPGKYSPFNNPVPAKKRQHYVLDRMLKLKKISRLEYDEALKEKTIYYTKEDELKAGYFTEWVRQVVVEAVGEEEFLTNGYVVKTTLDYSLQKVAEDSLLKGVKEIDKRQGYKGPTGYLEPNEFRKFDLNSRKKIIKNRSNFFYINSQNEKEYQFAFNEKAFDEAVDNRARETKLDEFYFPGYLETDDFHSVLENNVQYEAYVLGVDDGLKVIYVSLGGMTGIIPFEYFKWAHKRSVNENTAYSPEVQKPSTILKMGDLINVQFIKSNALIQNYLSKEANAFLNKNKFAALLKNQKYLLLSLDQVPEVQGAVFSLDARTGEIVSYVGGSDFKLNKFNRVIQAKRQPGSAFKPILFAAALENGYGPTTIIMDTPEAMPGFDSASSWKPKNYDNEYRGPVTVRTTLEESRNIPTIKMADKVGVSNLIKFSNRIGLNAKLEPNLSISLGSFGVSPRDLATAFAIFPNGGKKVTPRGILSVTDRDGKKYAVNEFLDLALGAKSQANKIANDENTDVVQSSASENPFLSQLNSERQVYDPRLAFVMTQLMKGVVTYGTAASARDVSPNIAGKTGTTSDFIDAWFVGFNSNVVTAVWTGFDDNKTMGYGETGGKSSLPIWKDYMRASIKKYGDQPFEMPLGIVTSWVDKQTGKKANPNAPGAILEYFADAKMLETKESNSSEQTTQLPPAQLIKSKNSGDDEYFDNQ